MVTVGGVVSGVAVSLSSHPNTTNNAINKTLFNLPRGINLEG